VPDVLLYQTSSSQFAAQAIDALLAADIPCHLTGGTYYNRNEEESVCICIERSEDSSRANEILVRLGAAVDDSPNEVHSLRVVILVAIAVAIVAAAVAATWM
jgi:hypothetical protein